MSTSSTSTSSGWNRGTSTPKPAPKKPSAMRGVMAGLVVVALAAACVFMFMGKGEKPVEKVEKERGRIKEVGTASLAERTGLSFSTVQRYVRKLRQERGIAA